MKDFRIGDLVKMDDNIIGHIVKITIEPQFFDEVLVERECPIYTIRVFKDFYPNGYFDFDRMEKDLKKD